MDTILLTFGSQEETLYDIQPHALVEFRLVSKHKSVLSKGDHVAMNVEKILVDFRALFDFLSRDTIYNLQYSRFLSVQ